jgi:glycosyltransferase involved in cell wall biosynthesis
LDQAAIYFTYKGADFFARVYDIFSVAFKSRNTVNHVTGDFNYATFFMPRKYTILTIHDLYRLYVYKNKSIKSYFLKWFWLKIPIAKSTIVTAISECTKAEILSYSDCKPDKIRVIYNCISPSFKPAPKKFNKERPVLLQIGTRKNKNLEGLIRAIAGINCRLEIVGSPSAEAMQLLEEHHIDFNCSGRLSEAELIQKYIGCDVLVFVSFFEGFGMPIIEANVVERVVVTGNTSAMPEIAGDAACLVDAFDIDSMRAGIRRVIEDESYREKLIEAGRENRKRFDPNHIANQYYELYREVYSKM